MTGRLDNSTRSTSDSLRPASWERTNVNMHSRCFDLGTGEVGKHGRFACGRVCVEQASHTHNMLRVLSSS